MLSFVLRILRHFVIVFALSQHESQLMALMTSDLAIQSLAMAIKTFAARELRREAQLGGDLFDCRSLIGRMGTADLGERFGVRRKFDSDLVTGGVDDRHPRRRGF